MPDDPRPRRPRRPDAEPIPAPVPDDARAPDGTGAPADAPGPAPEAGAPRGRSRARRVARGGALGLGTVLLVLVVVVGAALLYLRTEAGRGRLKGIVIGQIEEVLADDATVEAARLEGNFLTGARLVGLVIRRDGRPVMTVDTVLVEYNLTTLLRRTFSADELYIGGPTLVVTQRPDGTFDAADLLKPADPDADTTRRGFVVEMDLVGLHRGRVEVHFHDPDGDSVLVVDRLRLRAEGFHSSRDSLVAAIDTLEARVTAPHDAAQLALGASGRFSRELLALDELRVTSRAGTRLTGRARYYLGADDLLDAVVADVAADPLALEDVRAFTNAPVYGDPRLRLVVRPDGEALAISLNATLGEAQAVLDASLDRDGDGPLRYRAEGRLSHLDPGVLLRNDALTADLNGEVFVDFRGTQPRLIDGPFRLRLADSRLGGRAFRLLDAEGTFRAGRLDAEITADLPGARLQATATARPFDPVATYQARGTADAVDLAVLTAGAGPDVRFRGDFAVEGSGESLETAVAEAVLALDDVRVGREGAPDLALAFADATARLRQGTLDFNVQTALAGDGGRLEAVGTARPFDDVVTYRVAEGRVEGFDLAAVTGNPEQRTDLTGRFALDGRGLDPDALDLDLRAELRGSSYGDFAVDALDVTAGLDGGRLTFDGAVDLGAGGRVTAAGTARPFDPTITYEARGRVTNLDLAALTDDPARASDVTGAFTVEGRGIDPETLALSADLDLDRSRYGTYEIAGGDLALTLRAGRLTYTGTVRTDEGLLALAGDARPFDDTPTFAFREGTRFTDLDLGRLLGQDSLRTSLTGTFTGEVTGFDPATMRARGVVRLGPSTVNGADVVRGEATFSLVRGLLDGSAMLVLGGEASALDLDEDGKPDDVEAGPSGGPGGRLALTFTGRPFDAAPTYAARATMERLDLAALLGRQTERPTRVTGKLELDGAGIALDSALARGRLTLAQSVVAGVRLDTLATAFAVERGAFLLDTLFLRSELADATGGGRVNLLGEPSAGPTALHLDATLEDPDALDDLIGQELALGQGEVEVDLRGEAGAPVAIEARAEAERLAVGPLALSGVDTRVSGVFDPATGELTGQSQVAFDLLSTPTLLVERGDVRLAFDGDTLTAQGSVLVDRRRDLAFDVRAALSDPDNAVYLDRAAVSLDGDTWRLARPTTLSYGDAENRRYRVRNLLLVSDAGQQIAADGVIDPEGEQSLILTAEDVRIDALTDLVGFEGLGGRLSTTLALSGPAAAPLIDGTLDIDSLTSQGELVGALDTEVDYEAGRLNLDARLTHVSGQALTASGYLPLQFSLAGGDALVPDVDAADGDGGVRFVVRADAFPIEWVQPFLNPDAYSTVGGLLTVPDSITVTGTQRNPQLAGRATITEGRIGVVVTGRVYETITAPLVFEGNRIVLDGTTVSDPDDGTVRVDGAITLRELALGELDLTLRPEAFLAITTPTYRSLVLDGGPEPIRLTGTLERPQLRGSVVLAAGDIYLTEELIAPQLEQVQLSADDLQTLQARFGRRITEADTAQSRFMQALDYNLTVQIRQNVWLRSASGLPFDVEFAGDVRARKEAYADTTRLYGEIELVRGSVETLNRRFEVERGTIAFAGPAMEARADVRASLNIRTDLSVDQPAVTVFLDFQGRISQNPEIRLTSTPVLDPADIVSLIATGRLSEDLIGTGAIGGFATGAALGQLSGLVEGVAANTFGLDVVQVDIDRDGELVIRLGEYLTDRAFVSVAQKLGARTEDGESFPIPTVTLDYELLAWLRLQLEAAQRGAGAGLLYRYSY